MLGKIVLQRNERERALGGEHGERYIPKEWGWGEVTGVTGEN